MSNLYNKQQADQFNLEEVQESTIIPVHQMNYRTELSHVKNELNQAYEQIEEALAVASDQQLNQLLDYKHVLDELRQQVNL
ncbi:hypothetical protein [Radiobacillus sp. PE A8.2]|uniref:hypothetical protein n=1 Tax=Radiobacillus sp. PE A8.2 TaxID=3380349 RepID=UPI00388E93BF